MGKQRLETNAIMFFMGSTPTLAFRRSAESSFGTFYLYDIKDRVNVNHRNNSIIVLVEVGGA